MPHVSNRRKLAPHVYKFLTDAEKESSKMGVLVYDLAAGKFIEIPPTQSDAGHSVFDKLLKAAESK